MGVRVGAYATIWEVKPSTNYTDVRLSTSKKNKQTEEYEQDFSGYVRFIGTAHKNAASLKERDRIKIGECEITNRYNKEKNTTYTNISIFTFENVNSQNQQSSNNSSSNQKNVQKKDTYANIPEEIDEQLPFN